MMLTVSQTSFAGRGDFGPQDIFFIPLMLIGIWSLFKFSTFVEQHTQQLNILLRILIKGVCFILFLGIITLIIIGIGFIFEYIPEKWSMIF